MAKVKKKKARKLVHEKAWAVAWKSGSIAILEKFREVSPDFAWAIYSDKKRCKMALGMSRNVLPGEVRLLPVEIRELPAKKAGRGKQ